MQTSENKPGKVDKVTVQNKSPINKDLLLRLLFILAQDGMISYIKLPIVMDTLERHLKDPRQSARVSGHLQSYLSDLGLIAQIRNQLNLFQP